MIKNIIFDWSGTLSNNVDWFTQICHFMFKKLGKKPITAEEIRKNFSIPYMSFWNKYFPNLSLEEEQKLFNEARKHIKKPIKPYDNVKKVLERLHSLGINLLILSSDLYSTLHPEMKNAGVFELFMEINGNAHEKEDVLMDILKRNKFDPFETIYIGDTSGDVEVGKKAGVKTVGISWGFQVKENLRNSNPDYLIDDIKEIIGIVKNVQ